MKNLILYGIRIPITLGKGTKLVADLLPRVWNTAGFEKGIAEKKLGKYHIG